MQLLPHSPADRGARALLGREHPLAHAEERVRWLRRQVAVVLGLLAGSGVLVLGGVRGVLPILIAAAVVLALLAVGLISAVGARRHHVIELIADGRGSLPLGAVERERARLLQPRRVRGLARSLDDLRREARSPARAYPLDRALFSRSVVRQVDAELEQTAELLRSAAPEPAAVAKTERLLSGGRSPLYGEDSRRLREELKGILFALRGGTR
jgi:hypothetical protein